MREAKSRADFIHLARQREFVWCFGLMGDEHYDSISIGPWRCECGHSERNAGRFYDHAIACGGQS